VEPVIYRVSKTSDVLALSRQIVSTMRDKTPVSLMAIGAGAVNQAIKAAASARLKLSLADDLDVVVRPVFSNATDTVRPGDGSAVAMSRIELHLDVS
jgi:stage V sporulation protein SpoVS